MKLPSMPDLNALPCRFRRQLLAALGSLALAVPMCLPASPNISSYRVETRTALPCGCPFIEVSNLDERAGNAEAKLYRRS